MFYWWMKNRKSSSDLVGLNLFHSPTNSNTSTPTGNVGAGQSGSYASMMSPTGTGSPSNRQNTATPDINVRLKA